MNGFTLLSINMQQIISLVVAFVALAIASGISIYLLSYVGQNVVAELRSLLWKKLLFLPAPHYDSHQTGETITRMTNDTGVLKSFIVEHLPSLLHF